MAFSTKYQHYLNASMIQTQLTLIDTTRDKIFLNKHSTKFQKNKLEIFLNHVLKINIMGQCKVQKNVFHQP